MAARKGTIGTVTIASSAAASGSLLIPAGRYDDILVEIPAAWTAANLKVETSPNIETPAWTPVYDDAGIEVIGGDAIPTTGRAHISLGAYVKNLINALPGRLIRLTSIDTSDSTDENQAAERVLTIIGVPAASDDCGCK